MTRRWSLVGLIVALAAALSFVVFGMGFDSDGGAEAAPEKKAQPAKAAPAKPQANLKGLAWWPAREKSGTVVADAVGNNDAQLRGQVTRAAGPNGGSLQLDGATGFALVDKALLDTSTKDFSVAARVRIDGKGFRAAVSMDGEQHSVFFLQYEETDRRFAFSFINARAVAGQLGEPELGRWYHLLGTYSHASQTLSIYVDGKLAGTNKAKNVERGTGPLVIGRGKFEGKEVDFWSGGIADVHLFDRAVSAADAAALAAKEPTVSAKPPAPTK